MTIAVEFKNVSKLYRLGEIGTGTLSQDLHRGLFRILGKPDPFAKVGVPNDREQSGGKMVWALDDISFDIQQGEVLGIIGRNGAGKSTLLKLLSRVTAPTKGTIRARGRIASLLEVGTGFHPELTGRENIFLNGAILGMTRNETKNRLDEIVEFSGCAKYLDTPVKRYSSGMMVRLGFSVAAHLDCEVLVVDEVLAVGDSEFQRKCINKMESVARHEKTVIVVSHNLGLIRSLCERCVVLDQGNVVGDSDPASAIQQYLKLNEVAVQSQAYPSWLKHISLKADLEGQGLKGQGLKGQGLKGQGLKGQGLKGQGGAKQRTELADPSSSSLSLENRSMLSPGDPFCLELEFNEPLSHPRAIAAIYDRNDLLIADFDGFAHSASALSSPNARKLCCEVASLPLVPGDYYVNILVNADNLPSPLHLPGAVRFEVVAGMMNDRLVDENVRGVVTLPFSWRTEESSC
ncbi:Teichoic acids export ATP-binding protein TagH [Planctomycetes bacterium CA13]|uniref:Teichoic acids export ATP-binding protein TagH n=1 Tax=Novipirellula herctigrandis TaxID=2527986 RepID=A0A5C5Z1G0_9BACT|nr:Teichoic acids export ATP-binding protein TagH [Planctomycetes bacterium CA13]